MFFCFFFKFPCFVIVSSQVYYLKQLKAAVQCLLMNVHAWVVIHCNVHTQVNMLIL